MNRVFVPGLTLQVKKRREIPGNLLAARPCRRAEVCNFKTCVFGFGGPVCVVRGNGPSLTLQVMKRREIPGDLLPSGRCVQLQNLRLRLWVKRASGNGSVHSQAPEKLDQISGFVFRQAGRSVVVVFQNHVFQTLGPVVVEVRAALTDSPQ